MKTICLICCGFLFSLRLSAQESGPNSGTTFSTSPIVGSSQTWTDVDMVDNSDDKWAVFGDIPGPIGSYTDYLVVTNFGFSIPSGTVIYGITVYIERSDPSLHTTDYSIRIIKSGLIGGAERASGLSYPSSDAIQTYGGSNDLWGQTWSYKDITNEDFGIAVAVQRNSAGTMAGQIDNIRITVNYGFITLPVTLRSFNVVKENKSVLVSWKAETEFNMDHYAVERSSDGRNFTSLTNIACNNGSNTTYQYRDQSPLAGKSYYRLDMKEISGADKYSKVVPVSFDKNNLVTLSPSPWTAGLELFITNPVKETLTIRFYSGAGQLLGKTSTSTNLVKMPGLSDTKGMVYFKVMDQYNQLKGSGSLLIY